MTEEELPEVASLGMSMPEGDLPELRESQTGHETDGPFPLPDSLSGRLTDPPPLADWPEWTGPPVSDSDEGQLPEWSGPGDMETEPLPQFSGPPSAEREHGWEGFSGPYISGATIPELGAGGPGEPSGNLSAMWDGPEEAPALETAPSREPQESAGLVDALADVASKLQKLVGGDSGPEEPDYDSGDPTPLDYPPLSEAFSDPEWYHANIQ